MRYYIPSVIIERNVPLKPQWWFELTQLASDTILFNERYIAPIKMRITCSKLQLKERVEAGVHFGDIINNRRKSRIYVTAHEIPEIANTEMRRLWVSNHFRTIVHELWHAFEWGYERDGIDEIGCNTEHRAREAVNVSWQRINSLMPFMFRYYKLLKSAKAIDSTLRNVGKLLIT